MLNLLINEIVTLKYSHFSAALKVVVKVESSNVNSLTQQMSSLGQSQMNTEDGTGGFVAPTQPMSTPLRPPVPNATPFCSPTGYGMFGSGNVSLRPVEDVKEYIVYPVSKIAVTKTHSFTLFFRRFFQLGNVQFN